MAVPVCGDLHHWCGNAGSTLALYMGIFSNRCPACEQASLFKGFLSLPETCAACNFKYSDIDTGDGPAVFVIMLAGLLVTGAALYVELRWQPAYIVHIALWLPLGFAVPMLMLRPAKAWLIHSQYKHNAHEGRLHKTHEDKQDEDA